MDYARRASKRPVRRGASAKRGAVAKVAKKARLARRAFSPGSFVAGVICCAIAMLAIDWAPARSDQRPGGPASAREAAAHLPTDLPLTYEFIHRLPSDVVRTHVTPYEPAADGAPGNASESHVYLLQAASFLRRDDAEAMRAELLLEGMDANVSKVPRKGGGAWHRVLVGPFPDRTEMARALTKLRERDIPALPLVRRKPEETAADHAGAPIEAEARARPQTMHSTPGN